MAAAYVSATALRFGLDPVLLTNASTYWVVVVVSCLLAGRYRRLGRDLDRARQQTLDGEVELAVTRRRARDYRKLHDRVLQTLETIGRDGWVSDSRVRTQIAGEAAWLRRLIQGDLDRDPGDLVLCLGEVVERHTVAELMVALHTAGLGHTCLPPDAGAALSGRSMRRSPTSASTPVCAVRSCG